MEYIAHYFTSDHLSQLLPEQCNHVRINDLNTFLSTNIDKIIFFHIDTGANFQTITETIQLVHQQNQLTKVVIVCTELHDWEHFPIIPFIKSLDYDYIDFYISGILNFKLEHAKVYTFFNWLAGTGDIYRTKFTELLDSISQDKKVKPYKFDALLGIKKEHRTFIYNQIISNDTLKNNTIMSYHLKNHKIEENIKYIREPEMRLLDDNSSYSMYFGEKVLTNMIIPRSIYAKTQYSIVAETSYSNEFSQFTEKIAKPILSERLFIVFGGHHYLKNLRSLGFRTFSNVIDEGYDDLKSPTVRWHAAFKQVQILARQDPVKILNEINDIVLHNKQLLLSMRWQEPFNKNYL